MLKVISTVDIILAICSSPVAAAKAKSDAKAKGQSFEHCQKLAAQRGIQTLGRNRNPREGGTGFMSQCMDGKFVSRKKPPLLPASSISS